ncbi:MAG: rod shape-determining protein MreD [Burkholderiaceae bacterium]|nr:rod shape-determining protein MreD [Burkholderiaceae bacterium]
MVHKTNNSALVSAARHSPLKGLQPIDDAPFRRPASGLFLWFTIIAVWLISLLPWRLWQPAPELLLLVLAFWCLNEPQRVGMLTAFCFGLLLDVHDGALLGEHALVFTLVAYGAVTLRRRLQRFDAVIQAIHMAPVFVIAAAVSTLTHAWLAGEWAGWQWLWSALFTAALWPVADILLHMPQRRLDEADSSSV